MIDLQAVPAASVRTLRAALLRPGQAPQRLVYPGDDAPDSLHLAARDAAGETVGIASVMAEAHPRDPAASDWRVRGMAVVPELRGGGLGASMLGRCERHARAWGGRRIWCHARVAAQGFYERAGWQVESEVFDVEDIGPHVIMSKPLA